MSLENVNKKTLAIILVLIILLFINIPYLLFIVLFLAFLSPFLTVVLKFFKSDKTAKKEILKRYFFNIYWKKNLLFLLIFIIADDLLRIVISLDLVGLPIPYYEYNPISFSPAIFIFDIFFWYTITGLIIKRPIEISKNVIKLNYITLSIVLLVVFHLLSGYLAASHLIDNMKLDKKKIEECEMLSDKQGDNQRYSQQFNCYVNYAIKNNDIELCRLAKHKKEIRLIKEMGTMSKGEEVCYEEVALKTLDYKVCDNINSSSGICVSNNIKAQCYSKIAVTKNDSSICDKIESLEEERCEVMKVKEIKDKCYLDVFKK